MRARLAVGVLALTTAAASAQVAPGAECPKGALYPEQLCPRYEPLLPEGFVITRAFDTPRETIRTSPDPVAIDLPRDLPDRLTACWTPPPLADGEVAQITVRVSFNRNGSVIGTPALPFTQAKTDDTRRAIRASLLATIRACAPLRFTPSLGNAIAGRIFAIRYVLRHAAHDQRL